MHAAQVQSWGQSPKYIEVPPPIPPPSDSGLIQIRVQAAGFHQLVRTRTTGIHYSVKNLPHIPGTDGVGKIVPTGELVYFTSFPETIGGSFREIVNVPVKNITRLPDGMDPIRAAGWINPGSSSWMALRARCQNLPVDFSVLIMGATSASGRMAVPLARSLGAKRIIGCARNEGALRALGGLDDVVTLLDPVEKTDFRRLGHVDVVLDYVYGPPTEDLLKSLESKDQLTQYVHIGSLAALEVSIPGQVLRSKNLVIRGSGPGSYGFGELEREMGPMLEAISKVQEGFKVRVEKLSDVEKVWGEKGERIVFAV